MLIYVEWMFLMSKSEVQMKTNLDKMFKTEKSLEADGIWFDISETTGFKLKRFGGHNNPRVKELMNRLYKPYARMIENNTLAPEKETEITARIFIMTSMTDWKGVEIDGKEVPFSVEEAVKLMIALPELYEALYKHASDFQNFKEDLGN